jgi:hypothetical protein
MAKLRAVGSDWAAEVKVLRFGGGEYEDKRSAAQVLANPDRFTLHYSGADFPEPESRGTFILTLEDRREFEVSVDVAEYQGDTRLYARVNRSPEL